MKNDRVDPWNKLLRKKVKRGFDQAPQGICLLSVFKKYQFVRHFEKVENEEKILLAKRMMEDLERIEDVNERKKWRVKFGTHKPEELFRLVLALESTLKMNSSRKQPSHRMLFYEKNSNTASSYRSFFGGEIVIDSEQSAEDLSELKKKTQYYLKLLKALSKCPEILDSRMNEMIQGQLRMHKKTGVVASENLLPGDFLYSYQRRHYYQLLGSSFGSDANRNTLTEDIMTMSGDPSQIDIEKVASATREKDRFESVFLTPCYFKIILSEYLELLD